MYYVGTKRSLVNTKSNSGTCKPSKGYTFQLGSLPIQINVISP